MRYALISVHFLVTSLAFGNELKLPYGLEFPSTSSPKSCQISLPEQQTLEELTWMDYGEVYDEFLEVPAYSNKANGGGGQYQCVELIGRFIESVYGIPVKIALGNGHKVAQTIGNELKTSSGSSPWTNGERVRLQYVDNGKSELPPVIGSIISFSTGGSYGQYGHVAIVRKIEVINSNEIHVFLFEQHGRRKYSVGGKKPYTVIKFSKNMTSQQWHGVEVAGWVSPVCDS